MKINKFFLTTAFMLFAFGSQAIAQGYVIYDSLLNPMPGNIASYGYEATSSAELGDQIWFAGTARSLLSGTVNMSSWGCQSGHWNTFNCVTTPGATFSHPITLKIYNVGPGNTVGSLIGSVTQTFNIPYRPSADLVNCPGGQWFDGTECWNGLSTNIKFNIPNLVVPTKVIVGIAYNTTHYGASPIGESATCFSTAAGCGYDSLNLGGEHDPAVGTNPFADDGYTNSNYAGFYCDGGTGGTSTLRLDAGCWANYKPGLKFTAANPPTNANACKNNGWQTLTRLNGTSFKNQGDCVSYVQNGK